MPILLSSSRLSWTPILPLHHPDLVLATAGLLRDRKLCLLLIPPTRILLSQLLIVRPNLYQGVPPPVASSLPTLPPRRLLTLAPLSTIPAGIGRKVADSLQLFKESVSLPETEVINPLAFARACSPSHRRISSHSPMR
jgi:hypothetical protein